MEKPSQLIEQVVQGKPASHVIRRHLREFIDKRDAVDAVMLVIKNDGKTYQALMSGRMQPRQAAQWGIDEYAKHLFRDIREDLNEAKGDIAKEVERWIQRVKREG